MEFELTKELLEDIRIKLAEGKLEELMVDVHEMHAADIAEILEALDHEEASVIMDAIDDELAADVLMEADEDLRSKLLEEYSHKEIETVVDQLDSDDAADLLSELPEARKREVLNNMEDVEQAKQIATLLSHADDTAGSLMATELIKVNQNWTVLQCVREMRRQAEDVEEVYAVYVVDDNGLLLGSLSLMKLLTTSTKTQISEIYDSKIRSVTTTEDAEEVALLMQKYDLVSLPVTDDLGHLLGRITLDDVVDVITEEAEKDYNLASGLTEEVEDSDSLFTITKIRLPWLVVGLVGGLAVAAIVGLNEGRIAAIPSLAFFIPLIAAMGGNVGVQSSAIVVKALASNSFGPDNVKRLRKEFSVGLINGFIVALLMLGFGGLIGFDMEIILTVSLSLLFVVIFASLFGTFVPLMLDKFNIDPAVATGPFITTSNDVIALFIYFYIGRLIIGA
jgi:magnesium transporter